MDTKNIIKELHIVDENLNQLIKKLYENRIENQQLMLKLQKEQKPTLDELQEAKEKEQETKELQ